MNNDKDIINEIINGQQNPEENVDDEFLQDFITETKEHIEAIEMNVLSLEKDNQNSEIIHSMFRSFHTIKGLAGFVNQTLVQKIAHQTETLLDGCRKGRIKVNKAIVDLILDSSDYLKKICSDISLVSKKSFLEMIDLHLKTMEYTVTENQQEEPEEKPDEKSEQILKEEDKSEVKEVQPESHKKIGEILVEKNILSDQQVDEMLEKQKKEYPDLKLGQVIVQEKFAEPKEVIEAIRSQQPSAIVANHEEYMRVSITKLDNLVDMIGELMITQSLLEQDILTRFGTNNSLVNNYLRMTRITKDIQNLSMYLKMVSLKSTFQKITRIVRDTIAKLEKDVKFVTQGEDTEIDRSVTEKLLDPLVHLVKNAISHGIESSEDRILSHKPPQGEVRVSAYSSRGSVYIEVSDDGRGIDPEKVYKKALEKKLIDPSKTYTDQEIIDFILLPGFSTAEVVDDISGRGVGMDVVRTEVLKVGGKLEINSKLGEGSTFILKLPINNAVMNGTIVEIRGSNYIIPTVNVKQIIQPREDQWIYVQNKIAMVKVREDIIPIFCVPKLFGYKEEAECVPNLIVILELDRKLAALPVFNIIGRQEIVVKPLGEEFSQLSFVSGSSILGDGKVSLILDIESLYKMEGTK